MKYNSLMRPPNGQLWLLKTTVPDLFVMS